MGQAGVSIAPAVPPVRWAPGIRAPPGCPNLGVLLLTKQEGLEHQPEHPRVLRNHLQAHR